MRSWLVPAALLALAAAASSARGNKAPPPPPLPHEAEVGEREVRLVVVPSDAEKGVRLIIPQGLVGKTTAPRPKGVVLRLPTVVAGVALAAAFVSGCLWLSRRAKGRHAAAVVLLAALVVAGCGPQANDSGPKADSSKIPAPGDNVLTLPVDVTLSATVTLDLEPAGDYVRLIVNKSKVVPAEK
jgi:hypothetical protein